MVNDNTDRWDEAIAELGTEGEGPKVPETGGSGVRAASGWRVVWAVIDVMGQFAFIFFEVAWWTVLGAIAVLWGFLRGARGRR